MSVVTLFRQTLRRVPAEQQLTATLRNGAATTEATVLEGVVEDERQSFESGTMVHAGRREFAVLAAGLTFAPVIGMVLELAGITWSILDVGIMEPTDLGAPILYRLTAER